MPALAEFPALAGQPGRRLLFDTIRRMLSAQVHDVIDATAAALAAAAPADADAARQLPRLLQHSAAMHAEGTALKRLLFSALYRHPQVMRTTDVARQVVRELFAAYVAMRRRKCRPSMPPSPTATAPWPTMWPA